MGSRSRRRKRERQKIEAEAFEVNVSKWSEKVSESVRKLKEVYAVGPWWTGRVFAGGLGVPINTVVFFCRNGADGVTIVFRVSGLPTEVVTTSTSKARDSIMIYDRADSLTSIGLTKAVYRIFVDGNVRRV